MYYTLYQREVLMALEKMIYMMNKNFSQMDLENANIQYDMEEIQLNILRYINAAIDQIGDYRFTEE
ncbi:hypothetical protein HCJ28_04385 [Listeria sp. FSL L7-1434]|uniref:Uncharacterized protein n=2 Tax=Listeria TaxID=1637 RepID=A0A7X0ZBB7_9LIST|nr:hypothetical protein [Listeria cossartiae]MBC1549176.1 hypothetical protein [Listeria cossartiae subsp. cossartiae]MBC1567645.1 hypothetical protein [Listeria cossartiae subsp. cossartiae]MBC2248952.1 hypothetical protein [Listeria cossartiae subsp. cayugensis]